MLHQIELPLETRKWLSFLVRAQLGVLQAALRVCASGSNPAADAFQQQLVASLQEQPYFMHHADQVIDWVYAKPTLVDELRKFLEGYEGLPAPNRRLLDEKRWLVKAMKQDVWRLYLRNPQGRLQVYLDRGSALPPALAIAEDFRSKSQKRELPDWLAKMAAFLRYFYEALADQGCQPNIFRHRDTSYSRQDFFEAFKKASPHLMVCPVCDHASYLTTSSDGQYHGDVEHYLPQSTYPHLCVHPFNLVPVCKLCNQAIKRDLDPFAPDPGAGAPQRYSLSDILLPYRAEHALRKSTVVDVRWLEDNDPSSLVDEDFVWRRKRDGSRERVRLKSARLLPRAVQDLKTQYRLFARIYDIPGRWEMQIDEVYDSLFRRIRQLFADDVVMDPDLLANEQRVKAKLNWLLAFMDDLMGRDAYTYPCMWWLVELISRYLDATIEERTQLGVANPLLSEIASWRDLCRRYESDFESRAIELKQHYASAVGADRRPSVS